MESNGESGSEGATDGGVGKTGAEVKNKQSSFWRGTFQALCEIAPSCTLDLALKRLILRDAAQVLYKA